MFFKFCMSALPGRQISHWPYTVQHHGVVSFISLPTFSNIGFVLVSPNHKSSETPFLFSRCSSLIMEPLYKFKLTKLLLKAPVHARSFTHTHTLSKNQIRSQLCVHFCPLNISLTSINAFPNKFNPFHASS